MLKVNDNFKGYIYHSTGWSFFSDEPGTRILNVFLPPGECIESFWSPIMYQITKYFFIICIWWMYPELLVSNREEYFLLFLFCRRSTGSDETSHTAYIFVVVSNFSFRHAVQNKLSINLFYLNHYNLFWYIFCRNFMSIQNFYGKIKECKDVMRDLMNTN